ncbi:hypothetical protein SAMN02745126_05883 [Enhydrobacter aerosaccus]|uniref:Lipoprotein n=1 Tax=Enhydrobacter aerosaccus TaxID=225324 RepID=A0A1T4T9M9_9HYPH|nr:hypothetical protein [Enhydrobacter aerosaccus]SKA37093.1 hypothetical protein SAMN02745126_05883 [Enhydrobacter aerosaccus]
MSVRVLAVLAVAALASACSYSETRTVAAQPVDDSCAVYGYTPGTTAYNICVEREAAARRRGRMAADYAQASLIADSQSACLSYGLVQGTPSYDRCVQREMAYRRPL